MRELTLETDQSPTTGPRERPTERPRDSEIENNDDEIDVDDDANRLLGDNGDNELDPKLL